MSRESAICVSPAMDTLGRVEVMVEIRKTNGGITFQGNSPFYSSKFKCNTYVCSNNQKCILCLAWAV